MFSLGQLRSIHAIPRDLLLADAPINQKHRTKSQSPTAIVAVYQCKPRPLFMRLVNLTYQLLHYIYIHFWTGFFLVMFSVSETPEHAIQVFEGAVTRMTILGNHVTDQIPSLKTGPDYIEGPWWEVFEHMLCQWQTHGPFQAHNTEKAPPPWNTDKYGSI